LYYKVNYKGYDIHQENNKTIVENIKDFNPIHIFECGQCFRWIREDDGSYTGVVRDKVVNVDYIEKKLIIINSSINDFINLWYHYFDLGRDYSEIKRILSNKDNIMQKAIEFGNGIRLLQQELWETLISFIISANNRIPMIMRVISSLSKNFGEEIFFNGKVHYTFPGVDSLADECIETLQVCRGGFRCKYIKGTSDMVKKGLINLSNIYMVSTNEARDMLKIFPGVGPKVADCTLLYSGAKYDVFPTDVWVKRVMEELYFHRETSLKEIQEFAKNYFGPLAGFAQQYLFYFARENRIGAR
jgi:N-glycosylase/DNA lyase